MITEPKVVHYIQDLLKEQADAQLSDLEEFAKENHIPIVAPEAFQVLTYLIGSLDAKRVLELGTAMGYSSIRMARLKKDLIIDTLERKDDMIALAKENIAKFQVEDQINLVEGEILDLLPTLEGLYDLIFMDAGKSHYEAYLEECLRLLGKNGVIVCDNVLVRGLVAEEEIERKHHTIITNMKLYLAKTMARKDLHAMILPVSDGLLILKRKELDNE